MMKSNDLRAKQAALAECQCELQRVRDGNCRVSADVACMKSADEKLGNENCDLRKELELVQARNADLSCNVMKTEERLKQLDSSLFCTRTDVDCSRRVNCELIQHQQDKVRERDSLQSHVNVLTNQNSELSKELTHFVHQDEQLRE